MSTSELTLRAALVASAATVLLMLLSRGRLRGKQWWRANKHRDPVMAMTVERDPVPLYRRTRWWERFVALTGLSIVTTLAGAVVAILLAAGVIYSVMTATDLLKK